MNFQMWVLQTEISDPTKLYVYQIHWNSFMSIKNNTTNDVLRNYYFFFFQPFEKLDKVFNVSKRRYAVELPIDSATENMITHSLAYHKFRLLIVVLEYSKNKRTQMVRTVQCRTIHLIDHLES
jgi:hypothetical protein